MTDKEIVEMYERGSSCKAIAKLAGFKTSKSISDKLAKLGIRLRNSSETKQFQKTYANNFLEKIDAEWKGYFLGLLLTDGWVTQKDTLGWSSVDKDVAEYLSGYTGKSIQVVDHKKPTIIHGRVCNRKTEYRLTFTSKEIVEYVKRYGIVENKTLTLQGPQLNPDELRYLPAIMRGILDGDGTFGVPSNSTKTIYFRIVSASKDFIEWCINSLHSLGMEGLKIGLATKAKPEHNQLYHVTSASKQNINILSSLIYGKPYGMNRKRTKLQDHYINNIAHYLRKQDSETVETAGISLESELR